MLGTGWPPVSTNARKALAWKQLEVAAGNTWYDMFSVSNSLYTIPSTTGYDPYQGVVVSGSGLPPMSDYSDNVLVITFNDEAAPNYHSSTNLAWSAVTGAGSAQPTNEWISDYDNYTGSSWTGIQAAGGQINQFLYVASSGVTPGTTVACSVSDPCTSGPSLYSLYTTAVCSPFPAGCTIMPLEQITGGFYNTNNVFVRGCTGADGTGKCNN